MLCIDCSRISELVMTEIDCGVSRSGVGIFVAVGLQGAAYL
jgi:hypothetical protein